MEGKTLIEPTIVSDDEDDEDDDIAFLADCKHSDILDADINTMLECYLNLPKIPGCRKGAVIRSPGTSHDGTTFVSDFV